MTTGNAKASPRPTNANPTKPTAGTSTSTVSASPAAATTAPDASSRYGPRRRCTGSPNIRAAAIAMENPAYADAAAASLRPRSPTKNRADQSDVAPSAIAAKNVITASSHNNGRLSTG